MVADVGYVEVVVAHHECATLRVNDVFLKIDSDQTRTDVEVQAMAMAPIPTPKVLWRNPPVLALAALPGTALGRLVSHRPRRRRRGPRPVPPRGCCTRRRCRHGAGWSLDAIAARLEGECGWLVTNGVRPIDVVTRNRQVAEAALRPWPTVFTHGDLQVTHVFVDGDEITGVIDWTEAGQGDGLYDLATLTLGQEEHLSDVVAGYGTEVDVEVIHAWSWRSLIAIRWLVEHGFDPFLPGCEIDVLMSRR